MARILVVDDEEQMRSVLRLTLEHEGHEVALASDGAAAVGQYRRIRPDLVITDIVMPEKDGLEMIMDLWREFPEVRIIAISGGGMNVDPLMALECAQAFGAMRTFAKPFSRKQLLHAVDELTASCQAS